MLLQKKKIKTRHHGFCWKETGNEMDNAINNEASWFWALHLWHGSVETPRQTRTIWPPTNNKEILTSNGFESVDWGTYEFLTTSFPSNLLDGPKRFFLKTPWPVVRMFNFRKLIRTYAAPRASHLQQSLNITIKHHQ